MANSIHLPFTVSTDMWLSRNYVFLPMAKHLLDRMRNSWAFQRAHCWHRTCRCPKIGWWRWFDPCMTWTTSNWLISTVIYRPHWVIQTQLYYMVVHSLRRSRSQRIRTRIFAAWRPLLWFDDWCSATWPAIRFGHQRRTRCGRHHCHGKSGILPAEGQPRCMASTIASR